MSQMKVVKEAVKESLVGHEEATQMSAHTKAHFVAHAVKDPQTGELYMGTEEFITAVAPKNEDFVSCSPLSLATPQLGSGIESRLPVFTTRALAPNVGT